MKFTTLLVATVATADNYSYSTGDYAAAYSYSGAYAAADYQGAKVYYQNEAYAAYDGGHYIPRYYTPPRNNAYAAHYAQTSSNV